MKMLLMVGVVWCVGGDGCYRWYIWMIMLLWPIIHLINAYKCSINDYIYIIIVVWVLVEVGVVVIELELGAGGKIMQNDKNIVPLRELFVGSGVKICSRA